MKAEIISIGDELLIGQTINTNSSWIGEQLSLLGISINQIITISDEKGSILDALKAASRRVDVVLVTGGLGPTKDDITKHTLCEYFNTELVFNSDVFDKIENYFTSRGLEMLPVNREQAMLPKNSITLENKRGTASGMWFEEHNVLYVSMPGVPYEMKGLMKEQVLPRLQEKFVGDIVVHRTIKTIGIGESYLAEILEGWENSLGELNIKLAYLPSPGIVKLRLSGFGKNEKIILANLNQKIKELEPQINEYIYGYEKDELNKTIGELLLKQGKTLSTAESCTGGYIAHLITSVPGSSSYYKGSIVAYDNLVKESALDVSNVDLDSFGAVSQQVVEQMATGVLKKMNTDYSIATSGIAGPDGETLDKPVGTIWIAIATKESVVSEKLQLGKNRERNITVSALLALNMLRKIIVENN